MLHLHNILTGIWCIDDSALTEYIPMLTSFLKGENTGTRMEVKSPDDKLIAKMAETPLMSKDNIGYTVGLGYYDLKPEQLVKPGIALIQINGAMTKYASCENLGMDYYGRLMERCYAAPNVKGVILSIDSPGGEARSMISFAETLQKRNKPVFGFISDLACSAAMGIVSQCDLAVANNKFARVGSIGTMTTLIDNKKQLEKEGINVIELYATASKDKNKEWRDAFEGKTDAFVKRLDEMNDYFIQTVKNGRGERLKGESWNTGKTFSAPDAVSIGLIDGIDTFENVLNYFVY